MLFFRHNLHNTLLLTHDHHHQTWRCTNLRVWVADWHLKKLQTLENNSSFNWTCKQLLFALNIARIDSINTRTSPIAESKIWKWIIVLACRFFRESVRCSVFVRGNVTDVWAEGFCLVAWTIPLGVSLPDPLPFYLCLPNIQLWQWRWWGLQQDQAILVNYSNEKVGLLEVGALSKTYQTLRIT